VIAAKYGFDRRQKLPVHIYLENVSPASYERFQRWGRFAAP